MRCCWRPSFSPRHCSRRRRRPIPIHLVDTYSIKRLKPAPYIGTLGIGDPAVIFHEGKYYLYPTGDNHSYHVYISGDLVHWTKGPKVFQTDETGLWAPDVFFNPDDGMFYLYYTVDGRIGAGETARK